MSKNKINNMLKFTEYDNLQPIQKPTKKTEIGGFAVLEGLSIKEMVKLASQSSGMSKKELMKLTPKKLKKLIGKDELKKNKKEKVKKLEDKVEEPEKKEGEEEGKSNEGLINLFY